MSKKGKVYLVGAGPGDPGLLTVQAKRWLQRADTVIVDALVSDAILSEIRVGAKVIDAGKRAGRHLFSQTQIGKMLVNEAKQGRVVVRLKGGDPFIFGRGGEEAEALVKAKIPFEIVPGVSALQAVTAYAGIPLTHRDWNSAFTVVTGHGERRGRNFCAAQLDWEALAKQDVLVMYMGILSLKANMQALIDAGKGKQTPVAVIRWGTLPQQRVVSGCLQDIANQVKREGLRPPALVVIGSNVKLRKQLAWFENKPLFGKHILVTRSSHQAGELTQGLQVEAARVSEIPTIEIREPKSWSRLDQALKKICSYDWIVFTSANGVDAFFKRLYHKKLDARALANAKLASIGPATAKRLEQFGIHSDVVADSYRAEGLLKKLKVRDVKGKEILLARASEAREILPAELTKRGAKVNVAPCYESSLPAAARAEIKRLLRIDPPDLLTFASSSMVTNFVASLQRSPALWQRAKKIPVACIGPITAATAREHGLKVVVIPREYTIPAFIAAICRHKFR